MHKITEMFDIIHTYADFICYIYFNNVYKYLKRIELIEYCSYSHI